MAGFGDELRAEREGRGISLDQLCSSTKVKVRHFKALEEGNYKDLPGGVFRLGIVRAYLTTIGLDEQTWMPRFHQSYDAHARSAGDVETDEQAWIAFAKNVKRNRGVQQQKNTLRWLGVAALLVLVSAAGWVVWHLVLRAR